MRFSSVLSLTLAVLGVVEAHWEPEGPMHPEEIARRKLEHDERMEMANKCASHIAEYEARRKAKRELRELEKRGIVERQASTTATALTPHVSTIPSFNCIGAPEVTEGPYYIRDELVRSDLRETQRGVNLFLDVGVIDIATCQPAPNFFVELWASNATGLYSSFTTTDFPRSVARTDALNFLRGGYFTNENGIVEIATIYPGYYTSRTFHIHVMVHQNVQVRANGTVSSGAGGLRHVGQIFFDEAQNDEVARHPLYRSNQVRTYNNQDSILRGANSGGHNAFAKITKLGATLDDGLLGYITLGVNSRARRNLMSTQYFNPKWPQRPGKREEAEHEEHHHEEY